MSAASPLATCFAAQLVQQKARSNAFVTPELLSQLHSFLWDSSAWPPSQSLALAKVRLIYAA